jgi:copper(I)-binding protein
MKLAIRSLVAAATLIAAAAAQAQVTVKDAWVRATVPQQKATGAFMQLQSTKDTKLVSASSPLTPNVEVHEMAMQDNVMKMRQVPAIELPAGKVVELKPGSYHVMLMNLQKPVSVGDTVPLTLSFEGKDGKRETVEVQAPVRPLNSNAAPAAHGGHTH